MLKEVAKVESQAFSRNFWDKQTTITPGGLQGGTPCSLIFLLLITITGCARKPSPPKPITPKPQHPIHITGIEKALNNFHSVQTGVLYRSAQLSPKFLEKIIKKLNIKTIINLRGKNPNTRWWRKEQALAKKLGVTFYNIPMAASRLPEKKNLLKLLSIYKQAQKPILIHCYSGSDRTGEAAALWILEYQKLGKKKALNQLSLKYGHLQFKYPEKRRFITLWQGMRWLIHEYIPNKFSTII